MPNNFKIFTISPRTQDVDKYVANILLTIKFADLYRFSGILIFTGNDTYVEPWTVAQLVLSKSESLSPLVAVNPIYAHPFTVAKMISSLTLLYKRKIFINCVTGTSKSDLTSVNADLSHDDRYNRLGEFMKIVNKLVTDPNPLTYEGDYYKVKDLMLRPQPQNILWPEFFVAGASVPTTQLAATLGGTRIQMGKPLEEITHLANHNGSSGFYFGVITRPDRLSAWARADELFPADSWGDDLRDYSMKNTDAEWKLDLNKRSLIDNYSESYFIKPFKNFKADCPYYVGSYDDISKILKLYIDLGISTFIFDLPAEEAEYYHLDAVLKILR